MVRLCMVATIAWFFLVLEGFWEKALELATRNHYLEEDFQLEREIYLT